VVQNSRGISGTRLSGGEDDDNEGPFSGRSAQPHLRGSEASSSYDDHCDAGSGPNVIHLLIYMVFAPCSLFIITGNMSVLLTAQGAHAPEVGVYPCDEL